MPKSLKVAHVVRRYSLAEWGGTETVVRHTVEEQRALGHEPCVFCTAALQPPGARTTDDVRLFPYFYPYFPMPAADRLKLDKKGGSPYAPALFRAVAAFRPDVIHIHAGGRLACSAVRLAERRLDEARNRGVRRGGRGRVDEQVRHPAGRERAAGAVPVAGI